MLVLIEYATNQFFPLILVCASAGASMQEWSLSLMQLAKIVSTLYDYQSNKKLINFGMLGDIIVAEPNPTLHLQVKQQLNKNSIHIKGLR